MGFDLHMVETPKTALPGFESPYGDPGYFRASGAGIRFLGDVLWVSGVLVRHDISLPDPPAGMSQDRFDELMDEYYCWPEDERPEDVPAPTAEEKRIIAGYQERLEHALASGAPAAGTVPDTKFGGNDGWHVTPAECGWIADALGQVLARGFATWLCEQDRSEIIERLQQDLTETPEEELTQFIRNFQLFNRLAASNCGYRVL